tara:strand:- start:3715 stop:4032 length:318 start_codon:yes stop_codon:yes gene_type:complete
MDNHIWIYETKKEALDGALTWLKGNDIDDVVSPNRLVQTLIPNSIHEADLGEKCYMVMTLGEEAIAKLHGIQKIHRVEVAAQLETLRLKTEAIMDKNPWTKELDE